MIALTLALALVTTPLAGDEEAFFVDATLDPGATLLSWEIVRGLPGGSVDLVLSVEEDGSRELRVHAVSAKTVAQTPRFSVPILADVIAWGVAEVRAEPGRELVLITRGGAWSYSLTIDGYRNNAKALVRSELVYDMPDPSELPRWRYIVPGASGDGRDGLILPEQAGFTLWTAPENSSDGDGDEYGAKAHFPRKDLAPDGEQLEDAPQSGMEAGEGGVSVTVTIGGSPIFFEGDPTGALLSDSYYYPAPALLEVDGDGRLDLLQLRSEELWVHLGASETPTRVEPIPPYLDNEDAELSLACHDLDADGDIDILATLETESSGLGNADIRLFVLLNDGERLFPDAPSLVLKFKAAEARVEVTDVDSDGLPDLVVREFGMPSAMSVVGGIEFSLTHLIYLGTSDGFERRPTLRHESTYDENDVQAAIANYELVLDCSGDGVADLAAVDIRGNITVTRVLKELRFLRSAKWELEKAPWRKFETPGAISSLTVEDINGDGLGDLLSRGRDRLTIYLSQRLGADR